MRIAILFTRSKLRPAANDAVAGLFCDKQGSWEVENVGKCQTAGTYLVWIYFDIFCIILWYGSPDSNVYCLPVLVMCVVPGKVAVGWSGWLSWFCSCWWDSAQFPRNICSWIKPYEVYLFLSNSDARTSKIQAKREKSQDRKKSPTSWSMLASPIGLPHTLRQSSEAVGFCKTCPTSWVMMSREALEALVGTREGHTKTRWIDGWIDRWTDK